MKLKILILALVLAALSGFALLRLRVNSHHFRLRSVSQPTIPKTLALEDYQTPEDARIMQRLCLIEQSGAGKRLDADLVKPLIDDVNTKKLTVETVEATPSQFPELDEAVRTCSRILRVPKPRVFVCHHADLPIAIENYADPVMVIEADVLHQFQNPGELRFLVGRELAHIASHHVRWISLLRNTKPIVENNGLIGKAVASTLQNLLSRWVQECQITSDRGGLICSQDIRASERALMKLATGFDDTEMVTVNMDEYGAQSAQPHPKSTSGLVAVLQAAHAQTETIQGRIRQLKEYQKSSSYTALWKQ